MFDLIINKTLHKTTEKIVVSDQKRMGLCRMLDYMIVTFERQ